MMLYCKHDHPNFQITPKCIPLRLVLLTNLKNHNIYMSISDSATCGALFSPTNCLLNSKCQSQNITLIHNNELTNRERYSLYKSFLVAHFSSKALCKKARSTHNFEFCFTIIQSVFQTHKYLLPGRMPFSKFHFRTSPERWWRYLHHLRR